MHLFTRIPPQNTESTTTSTLVRLDYMWATRNDRYSISVLQHDEKYRLL